MFAIVAATVGALSSSMTSYYIYSYHADHFKETVFLKSAEIASKAKLKYQEYVPVKTSDDHDEHLIEIKDVKIIRDDEIIDFDIDSYQYLNWNKLGKNSLLHVIYQYQDQDYRIVFSYGQNLRILIDDLAWLKDGFYNGIDEIDSNIRNPDLHDLVNQYSGPLGDFNQEAGIDQNPDGFLKMDMTQKLFKEAENEYTPHITITNILGETFIFGHNIAQ